MGIGPDRRRLPGVGDFNVDLDYRSLREGDEPTDADCRRRAGHEVREQVTIEFTAQQRCPLPYRIDWSETEQIQDRAQIVDGLWRISGESVYPQEIGYDRVLAIGDYELAGLRGHGPDRRLCDQCLLLPAPQRARRGGDGAALARALCAGRGPIQRRAAAPRPHALWHDRLVLCLSRRRPDPLSL